MLDWKAFTTENPDLSDAATRLLELNEVAFIATVSADSRPRMHPFVPKVVGGRLVAFIMDSSPKLNDLKTRGYYAIHMLPGNNDEQFFISGDAICRDDESELRAFAAMAMGFATGVDEHHILFEFRLDRVLWTTWLDFGTPGHRPEHRRWTFRRSR
jgi:hypothetical protein